MRITIEPTGQFQSVNGQRCRIWRGVTDKGVAVDLFVPLIQVRGNSEFERELAEVQVERELVSFDYRMVI